MVQPVDRRSMLKLGLAAGAGLVAGRLTLAAPASTPSRFVFVILRGALDGLSAAPPYGDPDYARLRGDLALAAPGADNAALPLTGFFGLNPGLTFLHQSYTAKELLVFHACATPYRERSHFDGQDVLENGVSQPHAERSGWLNRALTQLPAAAAGERERGVALSQNVPLVLRGPAAVASWSPSVLPDLDADTLERIADRYASDPLLSRTLADALATDQLAQAAQSSAAPEMAMSDADTGQSGAPAVRSTAARYLQTVRTAAGFLRQPDGPAVAVFDTTGWDTHFNEGAGAGQLRARLTVLDQSLAALKDGLGDSWRHTVVLLATEFGRTAAANGTRGTDHGTASAMFLLGGAVAGGRVIADWPGLAAGSLYQQRDLRPTLDTRTVMKSVLHDHLQIAKSALDSEVFPDSRAAGYLSDLLRA
jgi:uncharacterized protein (DUF1501 family)